jgi:hypothetical protein
MTISCDCMSIFELEMVGLPDDMAERALNLLAPMTATD